MRLNSIKLSGFKSFVEPTHFQLPGQLVGVVGPNGCGKSNIIDAVRWVLGESKASELRGESMQDVIFNGSDLRKPAGRASVELAFDNAEGRAGGQWNRFAEIAVKRVLTRDGTSSYYINNQPVRRRDIQDVFLGTGLGPRAYAIIGQGTISRIIESKPEELRLFLEEAAGVSKYKERRRETENRLKDTRENLTRVEDILRELNGNLEKLEAQAEVAGRYRALQHEVQLKQHQLWFLKHRDATREEERVGRRSSRRSPRSNRATPSCAMPRPSSRRSASRTTRPTTRCTPRRAARRGRARSQPARRADPLRRRRPRPVQRQRAELEAQARRGACAKATRGPSASASAATPKRPSSRAETLAADLAEQSPALPAAKRRCARRRRAATRSARPSRQCSSRSRSSPPRRAASRSARRRPRRAASACAEEKGLAEVDPAELEAARRAASDAEAQHAAALAAVAEWQARVPALDEARRDAAGRGQRREPAPRRPRCSARGAAGAAGKGADRGQAEAVARQARPRIARRSVDADPDRARLGNGARGGAARAPRRARGRPARHRARVRRRCAAGAAGVLHRAGGDRIRASHRTLPRLADLLHLGDAGLAALLGDWLEGVYTASDFDAALAARSSLTHGEVIMTREGHAVSQFAVAFYAPDSEQAGMLARAQEIENLRRQTRAQALVTDEARSRLIRAEAESTDAAARLATSQREAARRSRAATSSMSSCCA